MSNGDDFICKGESYQCRVSLLQRDWGNSPANLNRNNKNLPSILTRKDGKGGDSPLNLMLCQGLRIGTLSKLDFLN